MNIGNSRRQSFLESFDTMSMKSSQRVDPRIDSRVRNYSEWHFDLATEVSKNINNVSDSMAFPQPPSPSESKSLFFKKFAADPLKNIALSEADSELLINDNEKLLMPSKEESAEDDNFSVSSSMAKSFSTVKNLTSASKKFKKVYHHRLIVNDKDEENEEKGARNRRNSDSAEGMSGKRHVSGGKSIAYAEDQPLFEEYCSFFKKNTDEMFDDKAMKNQLLEEMKVILV